jgi:hypothetical protein
MEEEQTKTEETPKPPSFYRKHTFSVKGPGRKETSAYLMSRQILLPHPVGRQPLTKAQIDKYFTETRNRRFPEQRVANLELVQRQLDKDTRRRARLKLEGNVVGTVSATNLDEKVSGEIQTIAQES